MRPSHVRVGMDEDGLYHYIGYEPGRRPSADAQTLCGRHPAGLHVRGWFQVGDPRGGVHFARACADCRSALVV